MDVDTPLKNFIEEIDFYDNKDIVVELFRNYFLSSEFKNLRIIKYTLRELKFFMDSIECDFKNNKKFLKRIVDLFISLSIESKLGNIKVKEIEEVFSLDLVGYLKEKKGEELNEGKKRLKKVKSRLNVIENTILNSDLWEQIIFLHNYDKKNINQQIESSSYFFLDTAPLWRKMMEMRYMDENQITEYCNFIAKELIGGLEKDLDVVMHYCGILLEVIDKELIDIKEINEDMLLIYLECFIVNSLKRIKKNNYSFKEIFFSLYENDHYAGYGFYSRDHPLFKDCRNRLLELKERMLEKVKVFEAETLLDLIDEDWDSFVVATI